ncbi:hypothetical protein, partial [Streptomyces sp. NPDC000229]|uniref:hypothetical protein n=1 Tax=Streptomyces sp. NPDC000229 TaxID=3154247 RepID=UPI00332141B5
CLDPGAHVRAERVEVERAIGSVRGERGRATAGRDPALAVVAAAYAAGRSRRPALEPRRRRPRRGVSRPAPPPSLTGTAVTWSASG